MKLTHLGAMAAVLVVLTLSAPIAFCASYYIDYAGGNDSNQGTSKESPWKKCPGMTGFSGSYTHANGDQFIFKGGVSWNADCFPWKISSGGEKTNRDSYGADKTWFTGDAWSRPILDRQGKVQAANANIMIHIAKSFVTLDNFDLRGFYWDKSTSAPKLTAYPRCAMIALSGASNDWAQEIHITNCIFHKWTYSDEPGLYNELICCLQHYAHTTTIDNCVFDGIDDGHGGRSGAATYAFSGKITNTSFRNIVNACLLGGTAEVSNCDIGPLNASFDAPRTHENCIEYNYRGNLKIFNNKIHDTTSIRVEIILIDPVGTSGTKDSRVEIYNNLIYNINRPAIEFAGRNNIGSAFVYNNTLVTPGKFQAVVNMPGAVGEWSLTMRNNHCIGSTDQILSGPAVANTDNLLQTPADAEAAGYTLKNLYRPPSEKSATVDSGSPDVGGLFTEDLLHITRPQGKTWDIGAYEFVPPTPAPAPAAAAPN